MQKQSQRNIEKLIESKHPPPKLNEKQFSKNSKNKIQRRPQIKTPSPGGSVTSTWYTPSSRLQTHSLEMGRYGLKRLDYSLMNPSELVWTVPPHPPAKTTRERIVFPLTLLITAGVFIFVYLTPEEEDMTEYWKRVESGQILLDDDEYDDGDDDGDDAYEDVRAER